MKYIKTYEDQTQEYKKGDYILLDMDELRKNDMFDKFEIKDDMAQIISIVYSNNTSNDSDNYYIIFPDGHNTEFDFVLKKEIKRLLTPEEIKLFKIKSTTGKYNL